MDNICEFCGKPFSTRSNLKYHQKTAKFCIKIQEKESDNFNNKNTIECEYCDKTFLHIHNYNRHLEKHKNETDGKDEINLLKEKLTMLEKKYEGVLSENKVLRQFLSQAINKPTTTNTTTNYDNSNHDSKIQIINNLLPLTDEYMREQSENLTAEHFKRGVTGLSDYAVDYPFKDRLICVDLSRNIVKYKNADGDIIKDPNMCKLTPKFFSSIYDRTREILSDISNNWKDKSCENTICIIANEMSKISDIDVEFFKTYKGYETPMKKEFIKNICAKSIPIQ